MLKFTFVLIAVKNVLTSECVEPIFVVAHLPVVEGVSGDASLHGASPVFLYIL